MAYEPLFEVIANRNGSTQRRVGNRAPLETKLWTEKIKTT
jgi:hypothetical protein